MGLLLHFHTGSANELGEAFGRGDLRRVREIARREADLSLNLSPTDLDLLSEEGCRMMGAEPLSLTDSLQRSVGGDAESSEANVVDPAWARVLSSIPEERIEELAGRWLTAVARDRNETPVPVTDDVRRAIRELLAVCRQAVEDDEPVVHTWSF